MILLWAVLGVVSLEIGMRLEADIVIFKGVRCEDCAVRKQKLQELLNNGNCPYLINGRVQFMIVLNLI